LHFLAGVVSDAVAAVLIGKEIIFYSSLINLVATKRKNNKA